MILIFSWREHMQPRYQMERNCSGPLQNRQRKDFNYSAPGNACRTKMLIQYIISPPKSAWAFYIVVFLKCSYYKYSKRKSGEDPSDGAVVERRGRFKVTSADVNPKVSNPSGLLFHALRMEWPAFSQLYFIQFLWSRRGVYIKLSSAYHVFFVLKYSSNFMVHWCCHSLSIQTFKQYISIEIFDPHKLSPLHDPGNDLLELHII